MQTDGILRSDNRIAGDIGIRVAEQDDALVAEAAVAATIIASAGGAASNTGEPPSKPATAARPPSARQPAPPATAALAPTAGTLPVARRADGGTSLNGSFTFDSFVSGKANQLARAAGLQVAEHPTSYNPLFVYGGVGLGKTHLIHAIGNSVYQANPGAVIRYIHAEDFVSDVVRAYQQKAFDVFKRYYRSLDLLLIDDIQFFVKKDRTQEEFFYAFNALAEAKKQIIITCDTYPKDIDGLEERLISRFDWGLTVQIEPPETEMRVAILKKKAETEAVPLPDDVAIYMAGRIKSNIRELEGSLIRLIAYASLTAQEAKRPAIPAKVDLAKAESLVQELFAEDLARLKKEPEYQGPLAARLLDEGRQTRDYPAGRYALLVRARDLATQAGDGATALAAIEELAQSFALPEGAALKMKIHALGEASKGTTTAAGYQALVDTSLVLLEDALAADNVAYAAINVPRRARVLVITPQNDALETALSTEQAKKAADVTIAEPKFLETAAYLKQADSATYDLIVFDQCAPKTKMPACNTLFIGRFPPGTKSIDEVAPANEPPPEELQVGTIVKPLLAASAGTESSPNAPTMKMRTPTASPSFGCLKGT